MKVKLLKRVRKRYSIIDNPNGGIVSNQNIYEPHFKVKCPDDVLFYKIIIYGKNEESPYQSKSQAYDEAYEYLRNRIRSYYFKRFKKNKLKSKIVWYK